MKRLSLFALVPVALLLTACSSTPDTSSEIAEPTRVSVLMISIDDLNDWVGCLGGLYNRQDDPHQWHNLAGDPKLRAVMDRLAQHIPSEQAEVFRSEK